MAFRSQKTAYCLIAIALLAGQPASGAESREFRVRHDHWRKGCVGTLRIDETGVSFEETKQKKDRHAWKWEWKDVQQLELLPETLRLLTYRDSVWKLGTDRGYEFHALEDRRFGEVYALLKDRLDQRFVAAVADSEVKPLWELPVKLLGTIRGSHGVLIASDDRIVYHTDRKGESRTWRFADIDNIGRPDPFSLSIITFERARLHYGSRKAFNFQLKEPLDEGRYNDLWRRINQSNGLKSIQSTYKENKP